MRKIYESPDGGKTVYQRESGCNERELVIYTPSGGRASLHAYLMEEKLWVKIRQAAGTDSALHSALERVKILYYLNMENGNNF